MTYNQLPKAVEKKHQPFTNATMREPTPGKPHIALIDGLWRVSPWKRGTGPLYYQARAFAQAHAFVINLNNRILFKESEE